MLSRQRIPRGLSNLRHPSIVFGSVTGCHGDAAQEETLDSDAADGGKPIAHNAMDYVGLVDFRNKKKSCYNML